VVELQLDSEGPKSALAAAKYVLQGTRLLGETELRGEASKELAPKINQRYPFDIDQYETYKIEEEIEALAKSKLKNAMAEAGLS
jgi:hypothetical protein